MRERRLNTRLPAIEFLLIACLSIASCTPSAPRKELPADAGIPVSTTPSMTLPLNQSESGEDWPSFLGPQHIGVSTESNLMASWPVEGPPRLWQKSIGTGYSAPSVLGSKLVIHHRQGSEEIVECLNAQTGDLLWEYKYASGFKDPYGYNNGPRCTPLLNGKRGYTLGAAGMLSCLDLDAGKLIWQVDLHKQFQIPDAFFGVGATPVLEGEKLIVAVGGQPNSAVVAFEAETGKVLWENGGKSTWDGAETGWSGEAIYHWTGEEMVVSYSSPQMATIHGRRHVLCLLRQGLASFDPDNGAENFHYWFRSRTHESVNAAQPVVVDDTILLGAAYRVGSVRLQVSPDGKSTSVLWKNQKDLSTHWSTSLYHAGCYFGFSGRHENEGLLQCVEVATGKVLWETSGERQDQDLRSGEQGDVIDSKTGQKVPWPYYGRGSAILSEGKLIVLAERGTLALVNASEKEWHEISRCSAPNMKYPCWAAPVLSRGRLYLRSEDTLNCLSLRRE